jgi:hypothetical protein
MLMSAPIRHKARIRQRVLRTFIDAALLSFYQLKKLTKSRNIQPKRLVNNICAFDRNAHYRPGAHERAVISEKLEYVIRFMFYFKKILFF